MSYRLVGAMLVFAGCGGLGFSAAAAACREERELGRVLRALSFMESQLEYRLTPLPELCRQAGSDLGGKVGAVFLELSRGLEAQSAPDAAGCMAAALGKCHDLTPALRLALLELGQCLGRFDLAGQLRGLEEVQESCRAQLERRSHDRDKRLRSYGTLGLCAGAALAILLL